LQEKIEKAVNAAAGFALAVWAAIDAKATAVVMAI
jgi:hypothetical protein